MIKSESQWTPSMYPLVVVMAMLASHAPGDLPTTYGAPTWLLLQRRSRFSHVAQPLQGWVR